MCGICGIYNFADHRPVESVTLRTMARSIEHRGPDDEGFFFDNSLGLGFRRLSIIDLEGGHQPMSDRDEKIWVVFNGEIFNFPELRAELSSLGHEFRTRSDTEVIIHGYRQWGTGILPHLNGMFGLAIWDVQRKRLVLARDHAGIKLIYYSVEGGSVLFGSELRPVLAALQRRPGINTTALNMFLRYRYTPSPLTLHDGVRKLAPGTMAVFEDGDWRVERWHRPRPRRISSARSDTEVTEELLDLYKRAMKRHLLSDVPVGLLLSGGIDSGLLLGLMNQYGKDWPTYTVGYGTTAYKDDELSDAASTARLFSARNSTVELTRDIFERSLTHIVSVLEEPVAASSIVPMYFVCERARQDVKVALVGQGPDELFGGYNRHLGVRYGAYWRRMPRWLRRSVELGIESLPRNETLKRGVYSLSLNERMRRYQNIFSIMPGDVVDSLFRPGFVARGASDGIVDLWEDLESEMEGSDELGSFQVLEIRSSLPDELLMYADKLSMAHGLEVRVPYLDKEIIEFAQCLPASFKIRYGQRKWVHRRVCKQFLPAEIVNRKKRGFAVNVVDQWFDGSMKSKFASLLFDESSLMYEILDPKAVRRLFDEHGSGRRDNHKMLFSLIVLEEWLRAGMAGLRNRGSPVQAIVPATVAAS